MLYLKMFPNSELAKNYEMSVTKVMFLMYIDGRPFTFHFGESTNQQVKKQYDGYVTFYSTIEKSIVTTYCGTLFVGCGSSPDFLNHFYKFFEENHLSVKLLLNLGMDGPNKNIALKNLVSFQKPAN